MSLQVTGKNIRIGESFQSYVSERLEGATAKYIGSYLAAHVRVVKERGRFQTSCSVRVGTGLMLESSGEGDDAYASAGAAFEHLEKRLRRYKRRLKNRHHGATNSPESQTAAVDQHAIELEDPGVVPELPGRGEPLIIAETTRALDELTVSEAVVRLDLTEEAFLVFRNASSGEMNVVYCRADGNIGWIDAAMLAKSGAIAEPYAGAGSADAMATTRPSKRQSVGSRSKRST